MWFSALVIFAFGLPAQAGELDKYVQIGFDAEISARNFHWLVPYFDIAHLESEIDMNEWRGKVLTPEIVDDYVLNRKAFNELPPALREKLSDGLNLEAKGLVREEPKPLVSAQGAELSGKPKLILNEPFKPMNSAPPALAGSASKFEKKPGLILPEGLQEAAPRSDWPLLLARWKNLPLAEKQAAVKLANLDNVRLAEVILNLPVPQKSKEELALVLETRMGAPGWLHQLDWSLDGSEGRRPIEFALKQPERDKEKAFAVIDSFAKETRTHQIRSAPHQQVQNDTAFHLHLGLTPDAPPEARQALEPVLLEYRRLLAIRMLAAGRHNDSIMLPEDMFHQAYVVQTAYDRHHRDTVLSQGKGLVRLLKDDHVEIREQTMNPAETYREFVGFLEKGPGETKKEVTAEISRLMQKDPSIARRIASLNPALLADFVESLPPGFLRSVMLSQTNDRETINFLGKLLDRRATPEMYDAFLEMRAAHPDHQWFDQPYIYHKFGESPEAKNHAIAHLAKHPEDLPIESYLKIMEWTGSKEDLRFKWLQDSKPGKERLRLLYALANDYVYYSATPEQQARVMDAFHRIYGYGQPLDEGVVIAKHYYDKAKKPFFLDHEQSVKLAAGALWSDDVLVARYAGAVLADDPNLFPKELKEGGYGVAGIMDYLGQPNLDSFVSTFAEAEPKYQAQMKKSISEVVRVGGPMPAKKLEQIKAVTRSESKVLSKAANELLPLFMGQKEKAHAVHGPSPGCEENFTKIR